MCAPTHPEVALEVHHLVLHERRVEHRNRRLLEGVARAAIEVAPARADARWSLVSCNPAAAFASETTHALMYSLGPKIHAILHPGSLKRLVRPSIMSTSSSSTSSTFSAAEMVVPSQLLV